MIQRSALRSDAIGNDAEMLAIALREDWYRWNKAWRPALAAPKISP